MKLGSGAFRYRRDSLHLKKNLQVDNPGFVQPPSYRGGNKEKCAEMDHVEAGGSWD